MVGAGIDRGHAARMSKIKRDKPLPPITDEEKPFALPVGWEWVRVATAFDTTSYQKEAPRLCRGGSRSLTFQEVVHRRDFQS